MLNDQKNCPQATPSRADKSVLRVRDMLTEDVSNVVNIEQLAHISPWARLSFEESLTKGYLCRVVNVNDEVLAYHVSSSVLDELHILNVVCAPRAQGSGLGHVLMGDILTYADQYELSKVFLEVRASNAIAKSLYEKWGFKQIAVRKKYYRPVAVGGVREDAHVYLRVPA